MKIAKISSFTKVPTKSTGPHRLMMCIEVSLLSFPAFRLVLWLLEKNTECGVATYPLSPPPPSKEMKLISQMPVQLKRISS